MEDQKEIKPFTIIVAATTYRKGIGRSGGLPWESLPVDMKFFKDTTTDSPKKQINAVIMGRNTFESIPKKYRPLVNRLNIVLTTNTDNLKDYTKNENMRICTSFECALETATNHPKVHAIFVIGGEQVYETALKHLRCKRILLTSVYTDFPCDTFFPRLTSDWVETERTEKIACRDTTIDFAVLERRDKNLK